MSFIIGEAAPGEKVLWGTLARRGKGNYVGKMFVQNGAAVMVVQAARNFPRNACYPGALLTLCNQSPGEIQATGS